MYYFVAGTGKSSVNKFVALLPIRTLMAPVI